MYDVKRVTMVSGATLTPAVDLGQIYRRVFVDTTGAASEVRLQTAESLAGTYRNVSHPNVTSTSAGLLKVPSSVSGSYTEVTNGYRFLKVETTAAVTNGLSFTIICTD